MKTFFDKLTTWKLYEQLHKQKSENNNLKFLNNGYLESVEYFRQRYIIEQRRAERKGYEFSLIVIDLNNDKQKFDKNRDKETLLMEAENFLFSTCKVLIRETDIVVKYCPYKLAILLPDTNQKGGQMVVDRIIDRLKDESNRSLQVIFNETKIYFYTFPLQEKEIKTFINRKIINKKKSTLAYERMIKNIRSNYSQINNSNKLNSDSKNSNIKITSTDTLAIENPFCLLNEVFFNFSWNWQNIFKRLIDVFLSLFAIIILLPVILLISILIKITSPGPMFFKQQRIGYMGNKFVIYKFRTMYQVKDEQIHKEYIQDFIKNKNQYKPNSIKNYRIYKIINDPRITPIGKFLRRTSLDEIGQLINVLKGDMSLVGPRPPIPYEVELYDLWHKRRFLTVKPGMTGLWQIYGRNMTTFDDMVRLDLAYANNWSIVLDIKILFKTMWAVLSMRGAY